MQQALLQLGQPLQTLQLLEIQPTVLAEQRLPHFLQTKPHRFTQCGVLTQCLTLSVQLLYRLLSSQANRTSNVIP